MSVFGNVWRHTRVDDSNIVVDSMKIPEEKTAPILRSELFYKTQFAILNYPDASGR